MNFANIFIALAKPVLSNSDHFSMAPFASGTVLDCVEWNALRSSLF